MYCNRLQLNTARTVIKKHSINSHRHLLPTAVIWVVNISQRHRHASGICRTKDAGMEMHVIEGQQHADSAARCTVRRSLSADSSIPSLLTAVLLSDCSHSFCCKCCMTCNASACLVSGVRKHEHVTASLKSLQWLSAPERFTHAAHFKQFPCSRTSSCG